MSFHTRVKCGLTRKAHDCSANKMMPMMVIKCAFCVRYVSSTVKMGKCCVNNRVIIGLRNDTRVELLAAVAFTAELRLLREPLEATSSNGCICMM